MPSSHMLCCFVAGVSLKTFEEKLNWLSKISTGQKVVSVSITRNKTDHTTWARKIGPENDLF